MPKKSYSKSKIMRDHETQLALINAFAKDPELKYYVGMAAGAGVAWVGSLLGQIGQQPAQETSGGTHIDWRPLDPWAWILPGPGIPLPTIATESSSSGGIAGNFANILSLGGTGFAGTCAMILILKAIFSGTDLGEILQGTGEIIPL